MYFRLLILSLACCVLPAHSEPFSPGLARAAADVVAAKGAALLAAKTAVIKGAANLAVKGATIGHSIILGAITGGLEATAEAMKPTSEGSSSGSLVAGALNEFSKVVELKKQLALDTVNPPLEPNSLFYEPIVVRDVVEVPMAPQAFVMPLELPVFDMACEEDIRFAPLRMLPPHMYHLGAPLPLSRRMLRRGRYPMPLVRTIRHH